MIARVTVGDGLSVRSPGSRGIYVLALAERGIVNEVAVRVCKVDWDCLTLAGL